MCCIFANFVYHFCYIRCDLTCRWAMHSHQAFSLSYQLSAAAGNWPARSKPRPIEFMRPGCSTAAVLEYLRQDPVFRMEAEVLAATGRSHSAVSWALLVLRARGYVLCVPDLVRNSRYLRYRAR